VSHRIAYIFITILLLQTGCNELLIQPPDSNQNMEDFEMAWNVVNDVYPMLEYKKIDWDSVYVVYRLRTENARGDEFSQVLIDLLRELKDMHVKTVNNGRGLMYPYLGARFVRDWKAFSPVVVRRYFKVPLELGCREKVEYGITGDNIGYIYLGTFDEEGLLIGFDDILDRMLNTKGLIIDVRHNSGGLDENVRRVVGRFITAPLPPITVYTKGGVQFLYEQYNPTAGKSTYTRPVVVLINGVARSAGDYFPDILGQLNNVTLVGDTTAGAGCADIEEVNAKRGNRILPSGRYINIPNTYFLRHDGVPVEWNGVPPDVYIPQTEEDIKAGRDKQLECAIELLNK
jgi:carboxyl-terminal processing protease